MTTARRYIDFIDFDSIEFRDNPSGSTDRGLSDNRSDIAIAIGR